MPEHRLDLLKPEHQHHAFAVTHTQEKGGVLAVEERADGTYAPEGLTVTTVICVDCGITLVPGTDYAMTPVESEDGWGIQSAWQPEATP